MTWYVVLCVTAGIAVGLADVVTVTYLDAAIMGLLFLLVFGVGLDIGARGDSWIRLRRLGPRLVAVPVASIIGSLCGVALVSSLVWGLPWRVSCALGSAFGWYSLSGPLLTHFAGPDIGAIAFLSDVIRELTALLMIPFVARNIGGPEAVALGGATSMDTTLPLISQVTEGSAAPLAFAHGMLVGLVVPVLIPFWFSI
jgi:uncharacterized membrane protein YbjE (DUF340 family)